ncbi:hypothetical protein ASPWEDRAFT_41741 [Aspergillus wentii DTO 134E9]|uniref:CUE domain-containing protein n=1 Tax=Aspergillus wentii DTO 134E9 TaxID=1073089 RepID=A0A1L9RG14_ASPWE|nr:uncharacterized protein ASPWEDRAFT_41741 [Aspergillus wentii DTO 134E9]KAI9925625.1 Activating signal cointegrator 1 complex subunit 2 [Aspergillus wentii]OJJ33865.1 hypothetical protein ASPWEDRAFT_41741 [Aspergillus wentii DTO 134E9]
MAELPPLAPVPPPAVRRTLQHAEWEACVDAWIMLLGVRIESSDKAFKENAPKDESAVLFLSSFYHQLAASGETGLHTGQNARQLRKLCFLLTRRLLLDVAPSPPELLHWKFLGGMCCCYPSSSALKRLLSDAWDKHQETITSSLEKAKLSIIKQLSIATSTVNPEIVSDIRLLTILASALPACGQVLITGSDFLDTFSDAYLTLKRGEIRKVLVANAYVGLTSLLKGSKPNLSLLLDQLFGLKAAAGVGTAKMKKEPTLLSDLICGSDLLARLERYLSVQTQQRGQDLLSSLRSYQTESKPFHHRYQKQKKKLDKGKSRAPDVPGADAELHAHRMSLVTQVQDLFPDLGSGYIVRLLDFYGDNTETVVAHLLDASLPLELQNLDISEQLPPTHTTTDHDTLLPRPTPPEIPSPEPTPARKNVFDEDVDIAELARSGDDAAREKLRFGRANPDLTADAVLADRSQHATNKAAILSALAAFDSDDDERDDTYDVADVGGTIDSVPAGTDADADADKRNRSAEEADMSLFRAYKSTPGLFARDSATRRSQPRASLKRETGMTDEAIEGWAVMLTRDPKRLSKLEDKLALGSGGPGGVMTQPELAPTSYRKPTQAEGESDDEDQPSGPSFRGNRGGPGRGRGRGGQRGGRGGGGRRGGNVNGPTGDPGTTASRQRKEENKSSRANHNRRQQRAKKIARGGGLPG